MFRIATPALALVAFVVSGAVSAAPVPYDFVLGAPSGVNVGTFDVRFVNTGTLIGSWDLSTNPTGTRTKPGIFGTFGDTENVEVPTTLRFGMAGAPDVPTAGGFGAMIDTVAGSIVLSDYVAEMPPGTPASLTLNLGFATPSGFRTRAPTSVYPGGDVTIPVGDATITELSVVQVGPGAPGTLTLTGPGTFDFAVAPIVSISLTIDALGNVVTIPGAPAALPMTGSLTLFGDNATITALSLLELEQSSNPNTPLPAFNLPLPTILPPGDTADLVFHLTLQEITALLEATVNTTAAGVVVPEPIAAAGFAVLAAGLLSRRRREKSTGK